MYHTNKRIVLVIVSLLIAFIVFAAFIASSPKNSKNNNGNGSSNAFAKGVSLSPRSFSSSDFNDFFQKAKQAGTIVSWAGDWNTINDSNSGAVVVSSLSNTYEYSALIELQFFQQSNGALLKPLNATTLQTYKNEAVAFAESHKPKYLALGVEVNVLFEKSPTDFEIYVAFYSQTYDAIKVVSPQTQVFPIFQLEKIKGLNGGLFGETNDPSKAEWDLLDRFSKMDAAAFTTYPGFIYKNPNDIPADYYAAIQQHTSKPVIFTEIGWHSDANVAGWESSENEQAQFISVFFNQTSGLNKEATIWSFLYDQNTAEPFSSMGLWTSSNQAKTAWSTWINSQ